MKKEIYKTSGNILITQGVKILQWGFDIKPKTTTGSYLRALIAQKTGLQNTRLADETYYYTDIDTVKDILAHDMVDEKKYEAELYDCDDFAQTIYSIFRYVFELNSMGTARGVKIVNEATGEHIDWHRANIFIAEDGGVIRLYYLEPQTDDIKEITSRYITRVRGFEGKKMILGDFDF